MANEASSARSSYSAAPVDDVLSVLTSACEVLRADEGVASITISLRDGPAGLQAMRKLAFRVAERYALRAGVELAGKNVIMRLSRNGEKR